MEHRKSAISPLTPIIAGLVVFVVILIYGTSFASYVGAQLPAQSEPFSSSVELDPEWRWQRDTVRLDGMVRTQARSAIDEVIDATIVGEPPEEAHR